MATSGLSISKEIQNTDSERYVRYVPCSVIYDNQLRRQPQCPSVDDWIKKHVHTGILHGQKKNEILPSATTWMNLEGIMLSELRQTGRDKYHDRTYMRTLKNKMNKAKQTHAGRSVGGLGEDIKAHRSEVRKSHGDVQCGLGNTPYAQ